MLIESLILGAVGAMLGLAVTALGTAVLRATLPADLPRLRRPPSTGGSSSSPSSAGAGRRAAVLGWCPHPPVAAEPDRFVHGEQAAAARRAPPSSACGAVLVVLEVSLAIVLLVGAGLFVSSFVRLLDRGLGFDPTHLVTISAIPPSAGRRSRGRRPRIPTSRRW